MDKLNFKDFSIAVEKHLNDLLKDNSYTLVRTKADSDELWQTYLNSYPAEVNGLFRERQNYDCNCCRHFIRKIGNILAIKNGKLTSVWDVKVPGYFQQVADALSALVKSQKIDNFYFTSEKIAGGLANSDKYNPDIKWDHFYVSVPKQHIIGTDDIGAHLGNAHANAQVLKRSLEEISLESAEVVLELINQNSLYRGQEFKEVVKKFVRIKKEYSALDNDQKKELYLWTTASEMKLAGRIKNTVIGTLMVDLTDHGDLEKAVKAFESKVAPENYKRTTALVSSSMIKKAQETIVQLGFEESISRRFATRADIPADEIIFTAAEEEIATSVFDDMIKEAPVAPKSLDKVETISLDSFISSVLPGSKKLEVMFQRKHKANLMTMVAPVHPSAKSMFKWDNGISWAYNGDVTDSIKDRVKSAGGNVEGDLRVSLAWTNPDDLDISCVEPDGNEIYYAKKISTNTRGCLDIDMNAYGKKDDFNPVENIFWESRQTMKKGKYKFIVHNFNKRSNERLGFSISTEFDGKIQTYTSTAAVSNRQKIQAIDIKFDGKDFKISNVWDGFGPVNSSSEEVWNVATEKFTPVNCVVNSPNHWAGKGIGNKHLFFIMDGCKNDEPVRGFFNEYLSPELNEHRKTLEILGSKTKATPSPNQVSGLGFSETKRDELIVRVTGKTKRVFKVVM